MSRVLLRHNPTGDERWAEDHCMTLEGSRFWWNEGNGSCDCNRRLFFCRAAGNEPEDSPCGEGEFSILRIEAAASAGFPSDAAAGERGAR